MRKRNGVIAYRAGAVDGRSGAAAVIDVNAAKCSRCYRSGACYAVMLNPIELLTRIPFMVPDTDTYDEAVTAVP